MVKPEQQLLSSHATRQDTTIHSFVVLCYLQVCSNVPLLQFELHCARSISLVPIGENVQTS